MDRIKDILSKNIQEKIPDQVLVGKVKTIDKPNQTCVVSLDSELDIPKVRLVPNPENAGECLFYPKPGSDCLIGLISEGSATKYYLIAANEYSSIEFFGGDLGGMVKLHNLVQKLNNIESLINQFVTAFGSHTHNDTATLVPTTPPVVPFTVTLTPTVAQDLENEKLKQ